jgi:signal recognition particle subunit SRP54
VLFVVDAMIGQDAVATAQAFLDGVGYDGVVLTKLDSDARGGAALSIASLTGKPIMFASTGEKQDDFDVFHPDRMASRILDMGDVLSLIEQAEKAFDASQAESMAERLMSGDGFTLEDFIEQLGMLRKLGPIQNLLGMMPGAARNKDLLSQVNDRDLDRAEAIVRSMTPEERRNPKIINGSRRLRIANGSGVAVGEVSQLVTNFFEGQRQMRAMFNGGVPGMGALMGGRRSARAAAKGKKNKRKHPGGDPRKALAASSGGDGQRGDGQRGGQAGPGGGPGGTPQSMDDLAEMLRDATATAGPGGGLGGDGFAGFRGGLGGLPSVPPGRLPSGGSVPAAFGGGGGGGGGKNKRRKKK